MAALTLNNGCCHLREKTLEQKLTLRRKICGKIFLKPTNVKSKNCSTFHVFHFYNYCEKIAP